MPNAQLAVTGYSAALINGQWQILPPKAPLGPLDQILDDLERALAAKFYYLAIMMALALPDVCACLESPNGNIHADTLAKFTRLGFELTSQVDSTILQTLMLINYGAESCIKGILAMTLEEIMIV